MEHGWVGGDGIILATSDGGKTWQRQYSGPARVIAFSFAGNADGWALTEGGLLHTGNGGSLWETVGLPGKPFRSVSLVDPRTGWGSDGEQVYATADGGAAWVATAAPGRVDALCFVNHQRGWLAGGSQVWRSSDGGKSWQPSFTAPVTGENWRGALACRDDGTWLLLTAPGMTSQQPHALFRSFDSGRHWTAVAKAGYFSSAYPTLPDLPAIDAYVDAFMARGGAAFFLGNCPACGVPLSLVQTLDGGRSWEHLKIPGLTGAGGIAAIGDQVWVAGQSQERGLLLNSGDRGHTWRRAYPDPEPAPPPAAPPVPPPLPNPPQPELVAEPDGFRLLVPAGTLGAVAWVGPSALLVRWFPPGGGAETAYLVDLAAQRVQRLVTAAMQYEFVSPGGRRLALTWGNWRPHQSVGVGVAGVQDGEMQTVLAADPDVPQWAGAAERAWQFGEAPATVTAAWLDDDRLLLTLTPQDGRNVQNWGKVLLADVATHQVRTLAERGQVAAVLKGGALLLRRGWVDGELQLLAPPYDRPVSVAAGGPWTAGWAVSPDGGRVAWLEAEAPPGDWSQRLPHACCSGDPAPKVRAMALWDRETNRVQRFPLAVPTPWYPSLRWTEDGQAVLFMAAPADDPEHTALFRLAAGDGQVRILTRSEWSGPITVQARGADGSLYYTVNMGGGANGERLVRLYPDGRQEVLQEGIPSDWGVDRLGRWITYTEDATVAVDLATGRDIRVEAPRVLLSPDGRWAVGGVPYDLLLLRITDS